MTAILVYYFFLSLISPLLEELFLIGVITQGWLFNNLLCYTTVLLYCLVFSKVVSFFNIQQLHHVPIIAYQYLFQSRIYIPVKHLRRSILRKQLAAFSQQLLMQNAPYSIFDTVLNTPLLSIIPRKVQIEIVLILLGLHMHEVDQVL